MGKSKHKKHHRHDLQDEDEGSSQDGASSGYHGEGSSGSGLKLILKVRGSSSSRSHGEKHKKKKKKKDRKKDKEHKHRHHHKDKSLKYAAAQMVIDHSSVSSEPNFDEDEPKRMEHEVPMPSASNVIIPRILPATVEPKPAETAPPPSHGPPEVSATCKKSLEKLLSYFLYHLQKKDGNQFFANPVDDAFAPGYSSIIKEPMDFSTMRSKIDDGVYNSLPEFKSDFELMCNNACVYNLPETVYYKAAKKLLYQGQKLMSNEKIASMKTHFPHLRHISAEALGADIFGDFSTSVSHAYDDKLSAEDDEDDLTKVIEDIREVVRRPVGRFEAIPDDMSPQEILDQVRAAAGGAANKLRMKKTQAKMGYLKQKEDGSISMQFLTGVCRPREAEDKPVSLAALISRIKQGTISIPTRRNSGRTQMLESEAYESTFANLMEEEMEIVNSTYGDEIGVQYAESILNFSRNCDYAMFIVDHLLDILTGNEHRKTSKQIEEKKSARKAEQLLNCAFQDDSISNSLTDNVDFNSLKTLQDVGIDVSYLDSLQTLSAPIVPQGFRAPETLQETAALLTELNQIQSERTNHSQSNPQLSNRELYLKSRIQDNLVRLASIFRPGDVITREAVEQVLGIQSEIKTEVN